MVPPSAAYYVYYSEETQQTPRSTITFKHFKINNNGAPKWHNRHWAIKGVRGARLQHEDECMRKSIPAAANRVGYAAL